MVTRYLLLFGAIGIGLTVMVVILPRLLIGRTPVDSIGEYTQWQPTPETIRRAVGAGGHGEFRDGRHKLFATMFQGRFRSQQKAVGISFDREDRIRAKFAATIPRWDMASVALQVQREAGQIFGRPQSVDIYETYISMAAVKIAEVRARPDGQGIAVRFDPRYSVDDTVGMGPRERFLSMVALSPVVQPLYLPNLVVWMREARLEDAAPAARPVTPAALLPAVMVTPR